MTDADVDRQLQLLATPFGGGPHERERDDAAAWLLEHAERAYPRLLQLLEDGTATAAVIALLPRFQRRESVAPLARLLAGGEATAWTAAQALASHRDAAAGKALREALRNANESVASAAADALAARGDRTECPALLAAIHTPQPALRYHALQAAGALGCAGRELLESLARSDTDADVRELAARLLRTK